MTTYYPSPSGNYNTMTVDTTGTNATTNLGTTGAVDYLDLYNSSNNIVDSINYEGWVGVGTNNPGYLLDVQDSSTGGAQIRAYNSSNTTGRAGIAITQSNGGGGFSMQQLETGVVAMQNYSTLDNAIDFVEGNVGINQISPASPLQVGVYPTNSYTAGTVADFNAPADTLYAIALHRGGVNNAEGLFLGVNETSGYATIQSLEDNVADEPLLLNPNGGNVGIGTTTTNGTLQVSSSAGYTIYSTNSGSALGSNYSIFATNSGTKAGANSWAGVFNSTSNAYGLYASDVVGATTYYAEIADGAYGLITNGTIYTTTLAANTNIINDSDERLKKDILPLTGALDKIERLNGVTFRWKKNGAKDIGVIAQNVEKVFPEIVKITGRDGMKGVEYGNLAALFIEAIKDQQKEIKDQQKQLKEQQKEIEELQKKVGVNK